MLLLGPRRRRWKWTCGYVFLTSLLFLSSFVCFLYYANIHPVIAAVDPYILSSTAIPIGLTGH